MKSDYVKKGLAVVVILLFIGVAFAIPINANVSKSSLEPVPDLDCDGVLDWTDVMPGSVVHNTIWVINIGGPGSELDWEIVEWPDWGVWTITPLSGLDLTPEYGDLIINVEVIAPDEPLSEFDGEIKIENTQNPDDFCIIESILITSMYTPFMQLLERFPNAFPILRILLEL